MWQDKLLAFRAEYDHPAWGRAHSERVWRLSWELAAEAGLGAPLDWEALFAAAHVHDLGALPGFRADGVDHAERSAEVAPGILEKVGYPAERVPLVQEIIRGHMFYAEPGASPEAVLFRDADTLDFLGATGITRLLAVVGLDDWTPDVKSAVALIERFSRELPGLLRLSGARALARRRQADMEAYLAALSGETDGLRLL